LEFALIGHRRWQGRELGEAVARGQIGGGQLLAAVALTAYGDCDAAGQGAADLVDDPSSGAHDPVQRSPFSKRDEQRAGREREDDLWIGRVVKEDHRWPVD
jgi:hypothetical protein